MPKTKLHTTFIDKLVPGGFGLGRLADGIVVLVRYALPAEKVVVRETGRRKDYLTAVLQEVIEPSPDRIVPPCPLYGRCGGCDLQHASPKAQLRLKKALLADSLRRAAPDIFHHSMEVLENPVAAPEQFGYRQRLRLQVDRKGAFGFFRPESHSIVPVSHCLLAKENLNIVLGQLSYSPIFKELTRHSHTFELHFNPGQQSTVLLLHYQRRPRPADRQLVAELAEKIDRLSSIIMQVEGYGLYDYKTQTFAAVPPFLSSTVTIKPLGPALDFSWEVGGFCQVNLQQNNNLIQLVLDMVHRGPHRRVLDLFCGHGNFSLPIALSAGEVVGIDAQNASIRSARENAQQNRIRNSRFEKNQVPDAVDSLVAAHENFDTVILDPPRQGAAEIMSLLPHLGAEQIIYISCNPATLARDLTVLIPAGYILSRLVPVDMFPQTHHLETVAYLKRNIRGS